jgi:hypothetical protein
MVIMANRHWMDLVIDSRWNVPQAMQRFSCGIALACQVLAKIDVNLSAAIIGHEEGRKAKEYVDACVEKSSYQC